jgi:biofilm PGA synthesis N-glycosyltransferase PgaC
LDYFLEILFWISVASILYTAILYPVTLILLFGIRCIGKKTDQPKSIDLPTVSVVVSVFNEEKCIREKLKNLESLDYPREKIEILIGSDGSTDKTNEILTSWNNPLICSILFQKRRGKASVLNDIISIAKGEVIVFSDANTFFVPDTVTQLVSPFADRSVGVACGELHLHSVHQSIGGLSESSYWSYENMIKYYESEIQSTLGATGAVYAMRKSLFQTLLDEKVVNDDFVIPLRVIKKGYSVKYVRRALAFEQAAGSVGGEFKRKMRIGTANLYGLSEYFNLLHPRYGFIAYALWSHKIIRWCVPFFLLFILIASAFLATHAGFYRTFLLFEIIFIAIAFGGFICEKFNVKIGIFGLPYYALAVNTALFVGFIRFLFGMKRATWDIIRQSSD